jgi:hypothetical protein
MDRLIRLVEALAALDDKPGMSLTLQISLLREEARAIVAELRRRANEGLDFP